jgi:hypothetical protein
MAATTTERQTSSFLPPYINNKQQRRKVREVRMNVRRSFKVYLRQAIYPSSTARIATSADRVPLLSSLHPTKIKASRRKWALCTSMQAQTQDLWHLHLNSEDPFLRDEEIQMRYPYNQTGAIHGPAAAL